MYVFLTLIRLLKQRILLQILIIIKIVIFIIEIDDLIAKIQIWSNVLLIIFCFLQKSLDHFLIVPLDPMNSPITSKFWILYFNLL